MKAKTTAIVIGVATRPFAQPMLAHKATAPSGSGVSDKKRSSTMRFLLYLWPIPMFIVSMDEFNSAPLVLTSS